MLMTDCGIKTWERLALDQNAYSPIVVSEFGNCTEVMPLAENALAPIDVTGDPEIVLGIANAVADPVYPVIVTAEPVEV